MRWNDKKPALKINKAFPEIITIWPAGCEASTVIIYFWCTAVKIQLSCKKGAIFERLQTSDWGYTHVEGLICFSAEGVTAVLSRIWQIIDTYKLAFINSNNRIILSFFFNVF